MDSSLKEEIIMAALGIVQARMWAEQHPEDPHHADSLELADDIFDEALLKWRAANG